MIASAPALKVSSQISRFSIRDVGHFEIGYHAGMFFNLPDDPEATGEHDRIVDLHRVDGRAQFGRDVECFFPVSDVQRQDKP